jgi:hypothetical protein
VRRCALRGERLKDQLPAVTHRDIKPINVGFTSLSKKQSHWVLLDFSLSSADATAVSAGTVDWRDPWLYSRGAWDADADRYAANAWVPLSRMMYKSPAGERHWISGGWQPLSSGEGSPWNTC